MQNGQLVLETPSPAIYYPENVLKYFEALTSLNEKDIRSLRRMAYRKISDDPRAFDIFSQSLWWPTRTRYERNENERDILWLAAKLYASGPSHEDGKLLLDQLVTKVAKNQGQQKLFFTKIQQIVSQNNPILSEQQLHWVLKQSYGKIDWRDFLKDLFAWNHDVRTRWASQFYRV